MNEKQASVAARIAELACLPMPNSGQCGIGIFQRRPDYPNRDARRVAHRLQAAGGSLRRPRARDKQRLEAIGAKHSKIKLRAKPRDINFAPGTCCCANGASASTGDGHRRGSVRVRGQHLQEPDGRGPAHHRHALGGPLFFGLRQGRCAMSEIAAPKARKRCAVYCRVSTDERLDQEFNSIDAQKEAGHAYIASQRAEGWIPVADDYDDPGFSGGNMERPALKRLMADIERGQIDIVVVYKIDRLTRSLADFSKMVEVFERHGVSFVSVTQQFNTTTSMGRLMLNVLLSFAQFEREVTGERIRDKIAAAKRKGMWMGGVPPLGYDVENRLLVINEAEAAVVRRIFEEMLTIGSPTQIAANLTWRASPPRRGRRRRARPVAAHASTRSTCTSCCATASTWASCRTRGTGTPARTQPIIDRDLWDKVHAVLAKDGHTRSVETKIRSRTDALLRGLLYAPSGERMYPTYSRKNGRKYHYYVSKSESRFRRAGQELRAPARAGDRGGGGRPDPHGADQPGVHRIGGAPHPAQRRSDRRSQYGDGDGAAQRRVGSVVPGRAPPHRQPDDRTDRPRPRW
jgi:site-specific DNA recombinase